MYIYIRVYKNYIKMVNGCRIDTGPCEIVLPRSILQKHLSQG